MKSPLGAIPGTGLGDRLVTMARMPGADTSLPAASNNCSVTGMVDPLLCALPGLYSSLAA